MPKIKKRFVNGMIVSSEKLNTVCFTPKRDFSGLPIEVNYDFSEKLLQIFYTPDAMTTDLCRLKEIEVVNMELLSPLNGCFTLMDVAKVNNVEFVQQEVPIRGFCQYLVDDSKVKNSGVVMQDGMAIIAINGSDFENYNKNPDEQDPDKLTDYCGFINDSGILFAHTTDDKKPELVNIYSGDFSGESYSSGDQSIAGTVEEFAVNDVKVFAAFIEKCREEFPTINFYNNPEEKDNDHYNEWINYKMKPRGTAGVLFSNHVMDCPAYGRYWPSTLEFTMEYSSQDIPTVLARRDQQESELFLNKICYFHVKLEKSYGQDPFMLRCALFWDRTDLTEEHEKETSQDETAYALNNWKFTGKIIFTNIEKKTQVVLPFDTAIFDVIPEDNPNQKSHGEDHVDPEPEDPDSVGLIL